MVGILRAHQQELTLRGPADTASPLWGQVFPFYSNNP